MKHKKIKVIFVVSLLMCMLVLSSVSAAPNCPNCSSFSTSEYIESYPVAQPVTCIPNSCDKQAWRTDKTYGCNDCYYNWFGYTINSWWEHSLDNCPNE